MDLHLKATLICISNEQLYIKGNHTVSSCYMTIIVDNGSKDDMFVKVVKVLI